MPTSPRRRRLVSFWLVTILVWVVSFTLGGLWLAIGIFWSVDSWRATNGGIEGSFVPQVQVCGPKDCEWRGDFVSADGTHDVYDVQFSSGFGEPQPEATGEAIAPVVIAQDGVDVYNPHDVTWAFAWIISAIAPFIPWVLIAGTSRARADWLRKGQEPEVHGEPVAAA